MKEADLPKEKACEPAEEASQQLLEDTIHSREYAKEKRTFADSEEKSDSQTNRAYKDVLSQPAPGLTHRQRLLWLQKRRTNGLWVQCDECNRWRYLPRVLDSHELPRKWYCYMNPDKTQGSCTAPEDPMHIRDEEDLIHGEYSAGSVVLARLPGWPWWPAMVDDCPDTEQYYWLDGFSDIPTHYNVVFFDAFEVTRAWISPEHLKPYATHTQLLKAPLKNNKYNKRLKVAMTQADDAEKLSLMSRLTKYSFISRWTGPIVSPKSNKKDIKKHQNRLKRIFNIDFPYETSDSEEEINTNKKKVNRKKNVPSVSKKQKVEDIAKMVDTENTVNIAKQNVDILENMTTMDLVTSTKEPDSMAAQLDSESALLKKSIDTTTTGSSKRNHTNGGRHNENDQLSVLSQNSDDFDFE